jgi:hypothetical protein
LTLRGDSARPALAKSAFQGRLDVALICGKSATIRRVIVGPGRNMQLKMTLDRRMKTPPTPRDPVD